MIALIKLGNTTYNLENIVRFEDRPDGDQIGDSHTASRVRIHTVTGEMHAIEGRDADALRWWLNAYATDILGAYSRSNAEKLETRG